MSKLRVNQIETLDGTHLKNVSELIDNVGDASVTTSTGTQPLTEALDDRATKIEIVKTVGNSSELSTYDMTDVVDGSVFYVLESQPGSQGVFEWVAGSTLTADGENVFTHSTESGRFIRTLDLAKSFLHPKFREITTTGTFLTLDDEATRLDNIHSYLDITGPNLATDEYGFYFSGNMSHRRHVYDSLKIKDMGGAAYSFSAGWNIAIRNNMMQGNRYGVETRVSPTLAGWAGSGMLIENSYIACGTGKDSRGISDDSMWCLTSLNNIMEYNDYPLYQVTPNGSAAVFINNWLENNTNAPRFRKPTVVIGGRGWEYTDVSLSSSIPDSSVIRLDDKGLAFYRDSTTGPTHRIQGSKPIQGAVRSSTAGTVSVGGPSLELHGGYFGGDVDLNLTNDSRVAGVKTESVASSGDSGRADGRIRFATGTHAPRGGTVSTYADRWEILTGGHLQPVGDGLYNVGAAGARVSTYYGVTSTIQTSDEREKQQISSIPDSVLDAWSEVEFIQYKWNSAVESKGEEARWHIGIIAQEIYRAFDRNGLDAFEYGLLCKDTIVDEDGTESEVWGIRSDECQYLELALSRREYKKMKSLIDQMTS